MTVEFRHCMDGQAAIWGIVREGRFIPFGDKAFCEEIVENPPWRDSYWKVFGSYPLDNTVPVDPEE